MVLFSFIILSLNFVSGVTLSNTILTTTGNITINIENFTIYTDLLEINNNSITFYNLTFLHPFACNNTYFAVYNYTTPDINSSTLDFPYTCSKLFYLSYCNSTNNITFLNLTFRDTITSINLNATINNSLFTTYPNGFPNLNKNYTFSTTMKNQSYEFCIYPPDYTYYSDYSINYGLSGYASATKVSNGSVLLTNASTTDILYLYNSSIPTIKTFQVINSLSQTLQGVYAYVTDYYDINNTIIMSGYTDSGGIIQFMLSNSTSYKIYFSKSGYDSYSTILTPTESFYTITLSGTGLVIVTPPDYGGGDPDIPNSKGVTYSTKPVNTWLNNGTSYNFSLTIDSGTWTLTNWGFNITDQNGNLINATSSTNASGGVLSLNASTSNYTKVIMNFYYTINGTTITLQRVWTILDLSDNQYSIKHALDDATSFIDSGLFGITTQGLSFIVFFIIFIGAGVLSYKYGLTSPVAICGFVFAMVYFFDVTLNWIPRPYVDYPIATILLGFLLFGMIVREVSNG